MLLRGDSCLQKEFGEELICRKPKQQSKYNFQEKQNMFIKKKMQSEHTIKPCLDNAGTVRTM